MGGKRLYVFREFETLMRVHLAVMLIGFGLIAFYIRHLFKSTNVKPEQKALWAVVLFMAWPIATIVYWWLYIWPSHEPVRT